MKIFHTLAIAAVLSFAAAPLVAQTPAPATTPAAGQPAAPAAGKKAPPKKAQRTAKSLECSKQANDQKLHGKPRKAFMNKCKKA